MNAWLWVANPGKWRSSHGLSALENFRRYLLGVQSHRQLRPRVCQAVSTRLATNWLIEGAVKTRTSGTLPPAAEASARSAPALASPSSPFRYSAFSVLWTATVVANVGGWMYGAAAGWLMTNLNPDPLIVSMVQDPFIGYGGPKSIFPVTA